MGRKIGASHFKDDMIKETPSFVELDSEVDDLEISRSHAKDDPDQVPPIIMSMSKQGSFDSNLNNRAALARQSQEKKFITGSGSGSN